MWPLRFADIALASGASPLAPPLPSGLCDGLTLGERPAGPGEALFAVRHDGHDGHRAVLESLSQGAGLCVVGRDWEGLGAISIGQRSRLAVCDEPLLALRALASWARARLGCPVVAVGGSNGKTTSKDLLSAMLSSGGRVLATSGTNNGWVGLPLTLTDRSLREGEQPWAVVLEVGIDEPGAMEEHARMIRPDLVVLTALGPEHLRGLGSPDRAAEEEMRLLEAPGARRVLLLDEPRLAALAPRPGDVLVGPSAGPTPPGVARLTYRPLAPSPFEVEVHYLWEPPDGSPSLEGSLTLPVPGAHAARNAALAAASALALGQTPEGVEQGLRSFQPPPMRCEVKVLPCETILVDDAFNASPSSVEAALSLLDHPAWAEKRRVVLLGDMLDLGAHERPSHLALVPQLASLERASLLFYGEAMGEVARALGARGVPSRHCPSSGDPWSLLEGEGDLEGAVVLIKGSRGMRLERASWALARRAFERRPPPSRSIVVGVLGASARPALALRLERALGRFLEVTRLPPGEGLAEGPGFTLVLIEPGSPPEGSPRLEVAVFAGLPVGEGEAEARLASLSPWVMSLGEGATLVIPDGDEAGELLAELLPEGARLVRARGEAALLREAAMAAGAPVEVAL